ncbi:MAG: hypothetical protein H7A55_05390 [Verrucomicrobiaceae bacterium]|nr:hypothetical protein [Verrucomicrobiaceae bacterium]
MSNQAKITNLDALESFRSSLIVFMTKARRSLDDASDEVRRTRAWIQNDQRTHWEGELRRRRKIYDRVQQELLSARLSEFVDNPTVQQQAVRKARAAVEEAEEKIRHLKKWSRDFDHLADPMVKRLESLRFFIDQELPKGIAYLSEAQKTLEGYTQVPMIDSTPPPAPSDTSTTAP